eukprot:scaffold3911_cov212-Pinguiococcus_pyrenoidosus.AAC.2
MASSGTRTILLPLSVSVMTAAVSTAGMWLTSAAMGFGTLAAWLCGGRPSPCRAAALAATCPRCSPLAKLCACSEDSTSRWRRSKSVRPRPTSCRGSISLERSASWWAKAQRD